MDTHVVKYGQSLLLQGLELKVDVPEPPKGKLPEAKPPRGQPVVSWQGQEFLLSNLHEENWFGGVCIVLLDNSRSRSQVVFGESRLANIPVREKKRKSAKESRRRDLD